MPDLTIEYSQVCAHDAYTEKVPSSSGKGSYEVHVWKNLDGEIFLKCECRGFEFRGKCKHSEALKSKLCDWDERVGPETQTPQQEMEAICPRCGSETRVTRVAV